MLLVEEGAEFLHLVIEGFEGRVGFEEFEQARLLLAGKAIGAHSQNSKRSAVILDVRGNLAAECHEVVNDNADDMEAVGDNASIGKPFFDEMAIGRAEVDADHTDPLSAL